MFSMFGFEINIENTFKLAAPFIGDKEVIVVQDLKRPYLEFLQSAHREFPILENDTILVYNQNHLKKFASAFSESVLNDLHQERMVGETFKDKQLQECLQLVDRGIKKLRSISPALGELFDLTVHAVILCGSEKNVEGSKAHGGTTNKCIGLIWLNLNPSVSLNNVVEMLIHELTHTLVFLDELNYEHFNYLTLSKKEYWATSSILKKQRPMDKVVHSIIVSMELLHARRAFLNVNESEKLLHPKSTDLMTNIARSIESVLSHPLLTEVCKPRAIELVQTAQIQLQEMKEDTYAATL